MASHPLQKSPRGTRRGLLWLVLAGIAVGILGMHVLGGHGLGHDPATTGAPWPAHQVAPDTVDHQQAEVSAPAAPGTPFLVDQSGWSVAATLACLLTLWLVLRWFWRPAARSGRPAATSRPRRAPPPLRVTPGVNLCALGISRT